MSNKTPNTYTKLSGSKLASFCAQHPSDPVYRVRLAEYYLNNGNVVRAIYSARRAHSLYLKEKNTLQLKNIIKQFGILASSEKPKHLTSGIFIRVANELGVISKRIKKVTLPEGDTLFEAGESIDYIYLVTEGELSIFGKEQGKRAMPLTAGKGSLIYEYDINPDRTHSEGEDEPLEEVVEYATKVKTYRGSKILVEEHEVEVESKPKMYRGQIVAEPEKERPTRQTSATTYRGSAISNLKGVHRYSSVSANSKCTLLKFTPLEIEEELQKYEGLHEAALEESATRFKFNRVTTLKLFSNLPVDLRYIISNLTKVVAYNEGDMIRNEDAQKTLHLISQGHMQVYQQGEGGKLEYIGRISQGGMIGLAPLLAEKGLDFIYQAELGCEVLEVNHVILKDIMALSEKFKVLLRTYYAKMVADFT